MDLRLMRAAGLACSVLYACFIAWAYASQPASLPEVTGGVASALGVYRINQDQFDAGLRFFRHDQFEEARAAFAGADPARQDPVVQFYVAYSYYRQGWGRAYHDDALYAQGIETIDHAASLAPAGRIVVDDPDLAMHSAEELKIELVRGVQRELSDFNPLRLLKERK